MHFLSILASGDESSGSPLPSLILLALIPLALYFFMIRPRDSVRDQQALQRRSGSATRSSPTRDLRVHHRGEDDKFWLEVDDDVQIRLANAAIQKRSHDCTVAPDDP